MGVEIYRLENWRDKALTVIETALKEREGDPPTHCQIMRAISPKPIHLMLMWANFGPYHLARLTAAHKLGEHLGCKVLGLELAGTEQIYPWHGGKAQVDKVTLFPDQAVEGVSAAGLCAPHLADITRNPAGCLALAGYDRAAILSALAWAKIKGKIVIFMSESKADDQARQSWKEGLKRLLWSPV